MSNTLVDISLRLNQLTKMRKTDFVREGVEDIFFPHGYFYSSDRCSWPVRLAETVLVKIMTMSWHAFSVMWQILSGNGHLMKIWARKGDSLSVPVDRTGGQTWPPINMMLSISHLIPPTHTWSQSHTGTRNDNQLKMRKLRPGHRHQTGGQSRRKREAPR